MTQSATRIANVKWNISVPPDFDEATRIYLASQGGKKGSLSSLVQRRFPVTSCLRLQERLRKGACIWAIPE